MFGYVRPYKPELKVKEYELFRAAYCGLCWSLKEKYGADAGFNSFLAIFRIRYAEGLLTMSTIPIIDVALDSGFNSVHTFIRTFKKYNQMTPSEYRAMYKEGEYV